MHAAVATNISRCFQQLLTARWKWISHQKCLLEGVRAAPGRHVVLESSSGWHELLQFRQIFSFVIICDVGLQLRTRLGSIELIKFGGECANAIYRDTVLPQRANLTPNCPKVCLDLTRFGSANSTQMVHRRLCQSTLAGLIAEESGGDDSAGADQQQHAKQFVSDAHLLAQSW